jgi:hypothetical protein
MRLHLLPLAALAAAATFNLACSGSEEGAASNGGMGNVSEPAGGMSSQNTNDAGPTSDEEIPLPMVVDFNFYPSGAFGRLIDTGPDGMEDDFVDGCAGDDSGEWDNVTIDQTDAACAERPSEVTDDPLLGLSRCSAFTFTPAGLDSADQTTWAGVVYQNSTCNWGGDSGSPIAPGATTLSFWAWGDSANVGSEIVFQVGGVGDSSTPHRDGFSRYLTVDLTSTPTRYEIDLSTLNYSMGVISAFGWTAERTTLDPLTLYVDGMLWQ